ncbi:MAG: Fumarate hydratase class I, anaerobic [Candidatus Omnitrophica bacterium]|nr:Fumarate hydratase class I, anaerobic [Candidatus Omnitrophota bacterium]
MTGYRHEEILQLGDDRTRYRSLGREGVTVETHGGRRILRVEPSVLRRLSREAFVDVSFLLRSTHLQQLSRILDDPEASENDRYVALALLKNAVVAAEQRLPSCQDTGTAIVFAEKGEQVWTGGHDEESLCEGIFETYQEKALRYSQLAPQSMFEEKNTGTNLPAQVEVHAASGEEYRFLFLAKGGGSANKSFLYQETKALLNERSLETFILEKLSSIGTSACPPYHLALVIGGTSAEATLKTVKLASAGYLDGLPTAGSPGGRAYRDLDWEARVFELAQRTGIGAQFGGKYLAHDVRVIRLPRHAASCPVGLGVSCSADRNIKAKITADGVFLEELERDPARFLPSEDKMRLDRPVSVDLDRPMPEVLAELSRYPVRTRLALTGTLIVARDVAHARIKRMLDEGRPMPDYFKRHPVYYAGPAKTPQGLPTGSFGPTTAGRMDTYVEEFQSKGGSLVMLAKGNRSPAVAASCKKHGGFYLGSVGGPAAILAKENIESVEVVDFEDLGMEAVRRIRVKDFPAFIVTDDKGNDFFAQLKGR